MRFPLVKMLPKITCRQLADSEETESQKSKDTLLRTQNLLAPLLSSSKHALKAQTGTASLLLPLGTPQTASASEGMLDLAKPGPRLALLPVNPTAA